MSQDLQELVEFLHHANPQIRQIADPHIFTADKATPVHDLKQLVVKDSPPTSQHALTILINLCNDRTVLSALASDDPFIESLLSSITKADEPHADDMAMLLANLAKDSSLQRLVTQHRAAVSTTTRTMDQLLDCFVTGATGAYNQHANYDHLAYVFADLSQYPDGRTYYLTPQPHDADHVPLSKLVVFTEHASVVRRRGVASTLKNVAFEVSAHPRLMDVESSECVLSYLLLPLMGSEDYEEADRDGMLDDLQLLPPDKEREPERDIILLHLDTILLLATTREGRDVLRKIKAYPVLRELHLQVDDDGVRDGVDRVVQMLLRGEEGEDDQDAKALEALRQEQEELHQHEQEHQHGEVRRLTPGPVTTGDNVSLHDASADAVGAASVTTAPHSDTKPQAPVPSEASKIKNQNEEDSDSDNAIVDIL